MHEAGSGYNHNHLDSYTCEVTVPPHTHTLHNGSHTCTCVCDALTPDCGGCSRPGAFTARSLHRYRPCMQSLVPIKAYVTWCQSQTFDLLKQATHTLAPKITPKSTLGPTVQNIDASRGLRSSPGNCTKRQEVPLSLNKTEPTARCHFSCILPNLELRSYTHVCD